MREIEVTSPLGKGVLLFHRMAATEHLGGLSEFHLDLLSEDSNIQLPDILGHTMTVQMNLPDDKTRYFDGHVSRFCFTGHSGSYACYQATVRPWFWLLTRTADCRIFQEKTVPEIIKEIFRELGFTDFEESLTDNYRKWVYCVQYRETDFNFISRLMEHEGIYYYFKHEDGKNTLVLADSYSAHHPIIGTPLPYLAVGSEAAKRREHISEWSMYQEIQPGTYALNDFDFEVPKKRLLVKSSIQREHSKADYEVYDYPGTYVKNDDGSNYARARIEALQAEYERVQGQTDARGIAVGGLFNLTEHPRKDQNREYLIVSATHQLQVDQYGSAGSGDGGVMYQCRFVAMDSQQPYRSPRVTPKPVVQGSQTATVVGKAGEEIWTDKYGRVKIQFHWDRYGKSDENSSCWVRVSHPWAGKNWGMIAIPRMGQEVIVDFLEGDPDQPIITGRVYNADQVVPYALPANATQTGILTRSSKGGTGANCNELRFEDKKGAEQVYLHAEKNQDIEVENDETTLVQHDRTETVGNNETISIGVNRTETVGSNESITVGANRVRNVGQNEIVTVVLTRTHSVGVNEMINVGAAQEVTVGGLQAITVGATRAVTVGISQNTTIGSSHSENIGTSHSEDIGTNQSSTIGDNRSAQIGKDDSLKVGKNLMIDAGDSITIKTGDASISMKKDGTITIQGKDITIKGSGEIDVKADKDIVMKGSKILQN